MANKVLWKRGILRQLWPSFATGWQRDRKSGREGHIQREQQWLPQGDGQGQGVEQRPCLLLLRQHKSLVGRLSSQRQGMLQLWQDWPPCSSLSCCWQCCRHLLCSVPQKAIAKCPGPDPKPLTQKGGWWQSQRQGQREKCTGGAVSHSLAKASRAQGTNEVKCTTSQGSACRGKTGFGWVFSNLVLHGMQWGECASRAMVQEKSWRWSCISIRHCSQDFSIRIMISASELHYYWSQKLL